MTPPIGCVTWQLYHTVRNAVVRRCRQFGRSGSMGERPAAFTGDRLLGVCRTIRQYPGWGVGVMAFDTSSCSATG